MTYLTTSHVSGVAYADYEKVTTAVGDPVPPGLLARYAGATDDGFSVVAVWETKAQADRFYAERLESALHQVHGPELPPGGHQVDFEASDILVL